MDTDVIVVGAGAAGLAAALQLAAGSTRVIALEARERIGGRVLSQSLAQLDVPVDLGAEFIHGPAPATTAFLREAGLAKIETGDASWTCDARGVLRPNEDDVTALELFERARSLPQDESVDAFLRTFEADPATCAEARHARAFVEGFEAADPALASTRAIADELRSGTDSTSSRPIGSYAPLFEHLATRCARSGVDLRLETSVERIAWERGAVAIETRDRAGNVATLRARCAIVTVSVGVLRQRQGATRLTFAPPLPHEKLAALHGLEMGHAVRVALAFRTPFWEHVAEGRYRDAAFFRCEGGAFNAFWTQMPLRGRSIVAWAGGPRATAMAHLSSHERIAVARDAFGRMLGEPERTRREFDGGATHDWSDDPLACGAYSYVVTGASTARADLGTPLENTLFFAGEATSTDGAGGTVSGAFETGARAATEVALALAGARTA